jgi:hypothetical protein
MRLDRAGGTAVRFVRRFLLPGHRATVPAGAALGLLLVTAAALAGPVGLAPLPVPPNPDPDAAPGTALSAAQPHVRRSLLATDDLSRGYSPTPAAPGTGPRAGDGAAAPRSGGGTRTGPPAEPGSEPGTEPGTEPGSEPGSGPPTPSHGAPEALPVDGGDRCARLFGAPWDVAAADRRLVTTPELADHVDPARGVRLRQALGGFAGDGAAEALAALRDAAVACPRFTATLPDGTRVGVTLDAGPEPADPAYAVDLTVMADGGRTWTGYLAADRVGPVLSVLWHLGPPGAVTAEEASATRRAAVAKARPLARTLGGDG